MTIQRVDATQLRGSQHCGTTVFGFYFSELDQVHSAIANTVRQAGKSHFSMTTFGRLKATFREDSRKFQRRVAIRQPNHAALNVVFGGA
jgi:hypothetical protein